MSTLGIIAIVIGCTIGAPFIISALVIVVGLIYAIICAIIDAIK